MFVDPMHFFIFGMDFKEGQCRCLALANDMIYGCFIKHHRQSELLTNPSKAINIMFEKEHIYTHRMHQHSHQHRHNMTGTDALHTTFTTKHQPSLSVATTNNQQNTNKKNTTTLLLNASNIQESPVKDWMKCVM